MQHSKTDAWSEPRDFDLRQHYAQPKEDVSRMNMVIHVCDEAKNVRQDFICPRDILVKEMKYFAEYLSTDAQKWEDVDISVHCDVQIFDWLMKYAKRDLPPEDGKAEREVYKLEPSNVISVLISSDFLKMNSLVEKCVKFCYLNMSAVIATPCNMNCVNDKLVTRISKYFNHFEVESVKDKKDKFKSKLFCKKLEELFDPSFSNIYSPSNASNLFRCSHCEKLLTNEYKAKVACIGERTSIDGRGNLHYHHSRDNLWDINDHILSLKGQLKTWRHVFWRIWGTVNYLYCSRCEEYFSCTNYMQCRFHPRQPTYEVDPESEIGNVTGIFPCCQELALKFSPIQRCKGCAFKQHTVEIPPQEGDTNIEKTLEDSDKKKSVIGQKSINTKTIFEQLRSLKDVACVSNNAEQTRDDTVCLDKIINLDSVVPPHMVYQRNTNIGKQKTETKMVSQVRPDHCTTTKRSVGLRNRVRDYEDEDQSETDEPGIVRVVINPSIRPRTDIDGKYSQATWDVSLPTRLNQDVQREEDLRRMNEMVLRLSKCKPVDKNNSDPSTSAERFTDFSQEQYPGGLFQRLESQLKASISAARSQSSTSSSNSVSGSKGSRFSSSKIP